MEPAPEPLARRSGRARPHRQAGGSLVGLLTVILVLLILVAAALPSYLDAQTDSERKICRANMRALAALEKGCRLRSPGHAYTTDIGALVRAGDMYGIPRCPSGGAYRILLGPATTRDGRRVRPGAFAVEDYLRGDHGSFLPGQDSR